ncbi:uncharacterized protein LOC130548656 isoform X2 [Triplophysa rosa]|uniref:uncharacterized protein LOC130548656 isoform X2 n=1 Tax=Triplophysa rosa TaxID=992332 RepID=UPI002545D161|nr:uncharacterized protein LOC130548656 isoform X2 [Triplophysa rosa]
MKTISLLFIISLFINGAVTESVTVNKGFSVTLHTNTVIQSNDVIEWRYGFKNEPLAKVDRGSISVFNGSDWTFSDKLKINSQTGDLTIIYDTFEVIGEYRLQITGEKTRKTFVLSGRGGYGGDVTSLSEMEGDDVYLSSGSTTDNYDVIRWRFQNSPLVDFYTKTKNISTHDERFRDRLELSFFGSLTITNLRTNDSGLYEVIVDSNSGTHTIHQSYTVTVSGEVKPVSVPEGDSVTLHTEDQIQMHDLLDWTFGKKDLISGVSGGSYDTYIERFYGRLQVDDQTGSLTITNMTTEISGLYQLKIRNRQSGKSFKKRFMVTVRAQDRSSHVSSGGSCVGVLLVFVWSQII